MKRFEKILCVLEPGKVCKPVLERAVKLVENNQADLTVINVIELAESEVKLLKYSSPPADWRSMIIHRHEQQLISLIEPYHREIQAKIQIKMLTGIPFLEIVREVLRGGYDLVIKMTEPQDWLGRVFGSDDMHLLRKCPCPLWLIKPISPKTCRRVLAAVDVSADFPPEELLVRQALNRNVIELAGSLALSEFAALHIVHVWEAFGENFIRNRAPFVHPTSEKIAIYVEQVRKQHRQDVDALMGEMTRKLGQEAMDYIKPQIHLIKGTARKEVPVLAKQIDADLIVMGTVARTGIPGFIMGNTAETILNQIECSVVAIKPPGFSTPITLEEN